MVSGKVNYECPGAVEKPVITASFSGRGSSRLRSSKATWRIAVTFIF
jgi:hypothetical protein